MKMLKFSQLLVKCIKTNTRTTYNCRFNNFTTSATAIEMKNSTQIDDNNVDKLNLKQQHRPRNSMVAAVFASLQSENIDNNQIKTPQTDYKILQAQNVDELLSISVGSGVSRRHALKVVSILSDWLSNGKVKLTDFETDPRFIRLCRILTKNINKSRNNNHNNLTINNDLTTILTITADDEAAKLVTNLTLQQMVKVMTTLSLKKRRSTPLLRALSYNITATNEQLDLKQSADILYSMTILNFLDNNLLVKISTDICQYLQNNNNIKKSSVIGSIITSLGLLKYKNPVLMDALNDWLLKNHTICRPQDVFSWFITLGVLNYLPTNSERLFQEILPQLTISEARKPIIWLDLVWSLVLLNRANHYYISTILNREFLDTIEGNQLLLPSTKLKLLNIDGAAHYLLENYNGPRLPNDSSIRSISIKRNKEKLEMVTAVIDTLKNLIKPEHLKTNIDTGLGFIIDAKCLLDEKCNPIVINEMNESRSDIVKIAVLTYDFHDMCRGKCIEPNGVNVFAKHLLQAQNYKILEIPYTEFAIKDKLIHRVQYLEKKLKELVITN